MNDVNLSSAATTGTQRIVLLLCLWAGVVGPILFVLIFTIEGALTPGYSAMTEVVSFLELEPAGWIQSLNFILTGLLLILFALGFFLWMRSWSTLGWLSVTTVFIALSGVGQIMAGLFFPDAPGSSHPSVHGTLHPVAFSIIFLSLGIASLFVGGKFLRTPGWHIHGWYSLLTGLFPIVAALGNLYSSFIVSTASKTPFTSTTSQLAVGGLINRVLILVAFAWYVILASRMLMRERRGLKAPGA